LALSAKTFPGVSNSSQRVLNEKALIVTGGTNGLGPATTTTLLK
jgi:hypothetical protein